jgi:transcriptional regulator with XRE-family HTH domain
MQTIPIQSPKDLGDAVRAVRKDAQVLLEDLAQIVGVSKQTATNLEQGKAKLETLFAFMQELGVTMSVEIMDSAFERLQRIREQESLKAARASAPAKTSVDKAG